MGDDRTSRFVSEAREFWPVGDPRPLFTTGDILVAILRSGGVILEDVEPKGFNDRGDEA